MSQNRDSGRNPLTPGLMYTLAASSGVSVANLYYNQPVLGLVAETYGRNVNVGLVPMWTQIGYTLGLISLVPLGDQLNRRHLILGLCGALALATAGCALAPTFWLLLAASALVGVTATITQIVMPLAADLATPASRGKVVGSVFSGALTGILLARTLSGFVGQLGGWRAMFWLASMLAVAMGFFLALRLPSVKPQTTLSYPNLMRSMRSLLIRHSALRRSSFVQACVFGAFSAFWSVLALHLKNPPYDFGPAIAGSFGLVGVIGVAAASIGGRLTDRYGVRTGALVGASCCVAAFLVFMASSSVAALVLGVVLLDLGVALSQVSNQSQILGLEEGARSRINTLYVTGIFFGGAFGTGLASLGWKAGGWIDVCLVGLTLSLVALGTRALGRN
jgi:predicted MFS family arabinose efflux permease